MAVSKVFKTFRGDVIFFSLMGSNDENCIEVQIFGFSKSSRSFTRTAKQLLPLWILGHELELVSAKFLMNSTTGMYQPFILLRQIGMKHSSTQELHVLLLEDYDSVILRGSFEISHVSPTQNIEFYFCDGPTVCWNFEGVMYFACYDAVLEKFTTDSVTVDNSMDERSGVEFNIFWCGLLRGQVVSMGVKSEMTDDASTLERWTCVNHTHKDVQEVSLVPNLYVPIATCCHVREPLNVGEFGGNSAYDNVNVYLATNRGQLLSFVNGRLRTYWQRPLQNVDSGGNKYTFAVNVLTLFWNNVWSCTLFVWQREVWWGILLVLATNVSATLLEIIIRLVEELLSVERGFLNLSHCSQQHAQHLSFFNEWSVCCSLLQCVTDYLPDPDSQKLQCRYQKKVDGSLWYL